MYIRANNNDDVVTIITDTQTAAASAIAGTLAAPAAGFKTWITGFALTGGGATGASIVELTIVGAGSGTLRYEIAVPAGVTAQITPLIENFDPPIPAIAAAAAITAAVPSFGTGNTKAALVLRGFQQKV